ncbi:hypothetical protein [Embleya scabrispora]|uniref:hypothetical protein n=1 Tax=Embleya scabrispora TaxID=159449 RepID=UPI000C7D6747|nr:hypothetical protein [Embleya scabrispora]
MITAARYVPRTFGRVSASGAAHPVVPDSGPVEVRPDASEIPLALLDFPGTDPDTIGSANTRVDHGVGSVGARRGAGRRRRASAAAHLMDPQILVTGR